MHIFHHKLYRAQFASRRHKIEREVAQMISNGELAAKQRAAKREQEAVAEAPSL